MNINQNKTLTKGTFEIRLRWPELAGVDAARLYDVGDPNETRTLTIVRVQDGLVIEVPSVNAGVVRLRKATV